MTAPAAQPDEAAGLVEKCARVLGEHHRTGSVSWYLGPDAFSEASCACGERFRAARDHLAIIMWSKHAAAVALSVLGPAIRGQHGEQAPLVALAAGYDKNGVVRLLSAYMGEQAETTLAGLTTRSEDEGWHAYRDIDVYEIRGPVARIGASHAD